MKHAWLGTLYMGLILTLAGCAPTTEVVKPEPNKEQRTKAASLNTSLAAGYMQQADKDFADKRPDEARAKLELAKAKLDKALALDDDLPEAYMVYGLLDERLGEYEAAERHYRRALRLKPDYSEANNAYGAFLCSQNRVEEADKYFRAAVDNPLYKTPEFAYENAGRCAMRIGDYDKAEEYLRKAVAENPRYYRALYSLARVEFEQRNFSKARAYLQRFHEGFGYTPETLWLSVRTEFMLDDQAAVANYGDLLRERFPNSQEAYLLRQAQQGRGSY
jgi:type IV pilus assembly protein PilF